MKLRNLLLSAAFAAGATIGLASQASAASLVICDAPVCGAAEGDIVFSLNDFEHTFQINSVVAQSGLGNPTTTTLSEGTPSTPNEIDFNGSWDIGGPITAQNETIFFTEAGGGISDVLHFTYSQDINNNGHIDGTVISDTSESGLDPAFLASRGFVATQTVAETNSPFTFNNTNITASFQSDAVPEPMTWAMMLVGFAGLGATLRMRRRSHAPMAA